MSPENKNPDPDETAVVDGAQAAAPARKGFPTVIIYVAIMIVMLTAGFFVGMQFIKTSGDAETAEQEEQHAEESKEEAKPTELYMIEDIIVNPSGTGGTRFLSASIGFEVYSQETHAMFEQRQHLVRDALITILGAKTIEQLSEPKQKEITRFQIKKRVEQILKVDDLAAVYFTEFILQ